MGDSPFPARGLKALSGLKELKLLSLDRCTGLQDDDFDLLGGLETLRTLYLEGTQAGDKAMTSIAGLKYLDALYAGSPELTDAGMDKMADIVSLTRIRITGAEGISDEGLRSLGRVNRLKQLELHSPIITGSGVSGLKLLPEFQEIFLTSPAMTNVVFEELSQCRFLIKVRLVESRTQPASALTDEGNATHGTSSKAA